MNKNRLIELYQNTSKHSNYQILPTGLSAILSQNDVQTKSRFEKERLQFLTDNLDFNGKKILDIGGNTGYFSFESLEIGAKEVVYIEGNTPHADFVNEAKNILQKPITVKNEYLDFQTPIAEAPFDIVLLFNVIHHLGDDYGEKSISVEKAKEKMIDCINYFIGKTNILVLQMGFCWKGDISQPLFENGTKEEMIDFVKTAIKDRWKIKTIGIAEEADKLTSYKSLNEENKRRQDRLGEFRNRPIFILERK